MTVTILKDTVSPDNIRLTTIQCRIPTRFLPAFLHVRELSVSVGDPNYSLAPLVVEPALPSGFSEMSAERILGRAREAALQASSQFRRLGDPGSETLAYRVIEQYTLTDVIMTASRWQDAFDQLGYKASKEMALLVKDIRTALHNSSPTPLRHNGWHIPFIDKEDIDAALDMVVQDLFKMSAGPSAHAFPDSEDSILSMSIGVLLRASVVRITHGMRGGDQRRATLDRELALFNSTDRPYSSFRPDAFEHQATPDLKGDTGGWLHPSSHGNLPGWCQYRQVAATEYSAYKTGKGI